MFGVFSSVDDIGALNENETANESAPVADESTPISDESAAVSDESPYIDPFRRDLCTPLSSDTSASEKCRLLRRFSAALIWTTF